MSYRYTGYSVSGVDVFIWFLLTAGSISFPVIVLAICCIRQHISNNKKTKHLAHLLDGDVFDRKRMTGFNRYFFNESSVNENNQPSTAENSTNGSPTNKKPNYSAKILSQLSKPPAKITAIGKNNYTNEATASGNDQTNNPNFNSNMPIISRDIYSISDSYENAPDVNYAKINSAFDKNDNQLTRENFENLYSQVTKKSTTQSSYNNNRNPSIRNDQALYMNTFYSS